MPASALRARCVLLFERRRNNDIVLFIGARARFHVRRVYYKRGIVFLNHFTIDAILWLRD